MKTYRNVFLGMSVAFLFIVAFTAMPAQAATQEIDITGLKVSEVQTQIENTMATATAGDFIDIKGSLVGADDTLTINYNKNVSVRWSADWSTDASLGDKPAIYVTKNLEVTDRVLFHVSDANIENKTGNVLQVDGDIHLRIQKGKAGTTIRGGGENPTVVHTGPLPNDFGEFIFECRGPVVENTSTGPALKGDQIHLLVGSNISATFGTPVETGRLNIGENSIITAKNPAVPAVTAQLVDFAGNGKATINGDVKLEDDLSIDGGPGLLLKYGDAQATINGNVNFSTGSLDAAAGTLVITGNATSSHDFNLAHISSTNSKTPVHVEIRGNVTSTTGHGLVLSGNQATAVVGDMKAAKYAVQATEGAKVTVEGGVEAMEWLPVTIGSNAEVVVQGNVMLNGQTLTSNSGGSVRFDGTITNANSAEYIQYDDSGIKYVAMEPLPTVTSIDGKDYYDYVYQANGLLSHVYVYWRDTPVTPPTPPTEKDERYILTFNTQGGSDVPALSGSQGVTIDLGRIQSEREGYTFGGWFADAAGTVRLTDFTFHADRTIYAKWLDSTKPPEDPVNPEDPGMPFTDVQPGDWFYNAVQYVYQNKLMVGTSETEFSPGASTTRGMIVTILHRLEGNPDAKALPNPFKDVAENQWYRDSVVWAANEGIVAGYGEGRFGPEDPITREQLAAIQRNYTAYKGRDTSHRTELTAYRDAANVSAWAKDAMSWAVATGLIRGEGENLNPTGHAQRSHVAAILERYLESK